MTNLNINWEFRPDGTAVVNVDGGDAEVTWTATASVLSFVAVNNSNGKVDFNIKSLSKDELHLEYIDDDEVANGISYKSVREYRLRKK